MVTGEYNRFGYCIFIDGHLEYYVGNSQCDSLAVADPESPMALPLGTIKASCIQVGQDLALEHDLSWGGCTEQQ